jgi:hypothetical protein
MMKFILAVMIVIEVGTAAAAQLFITQRRRVSRCLRCCRQMLLQSRTITSKKSTIRLMKKSARSSILLSRRVVMYPQ